MGNSICGPDQPDQRPKASSENKKSNKNLPANSQAVDEAIMKQRRLTQEERVKQAEHFLSFKTTQAFKNIENFSDHYDIVRPLGAGAFGEVCLGEHKKSNVPCAIKIIRK